MKSGDNGRKTGTSGPKIRRKPLRTSGGGSKPYPIPWEGLIGPNDKNKTVSRPDPVQYGSPC
jgi:hypothetical protein